jgi:hypothetical protein
MKPSLGQTIVAIAATVVGVSIIAGVILVGSPAEGRLEQLDSTRVDDLQGIMRAMDSFWDREERLATSLDELAEDARTRVNTIDPDSAEPYEYQASGEDSYELCATFARQSLEPPGRASADFWTHPAGRHCFALVVDPEN